MKNSKTILVLIAIACLLITMCACNNVVYVSVGIANGDHFSVLGDDFKRVQVGQSVTFNVQIEQGYHLATLPENATYSNGELTISSVNVPTLIELDVCKQTFLVSVSGNGVTHQTVEVGYGETAQIELILGEGYSYVSNSANAFYDAQNGKLVVENVIQNTTVAVATTQELVQVRLLQSWLSSSDAEYKYAVLGDTVSFDLEIRNGFEFVGCDYQGSYFYQNGKLTLYGVYENVIVSQEIRQKQNTNQVTLIDGVGFEIIGQSAKTPVNGEVVFNVEIDENFEYVANSANGTFDEQNGTLTISNVEQGATVFLLATQHTFNVSVLSGEGFSVVGDTQKTVSKGESVTFEIEFEQGFNYESNNANAIYDSTNGTLTIQKVFLSTAIKIDVVGENDEVNTLANGKQIKRVLQDKIKFMAKPNDGWYFVNWTYRGENGATQIYSYANNLELDSSFALNLQANFASEQTTQKIVYHVSGGNLFNSQDKSVNYAFEQGVYLYPASFGEWFFKTFYREGYHVKEYEYIPFDTKVALSLGSRIFSDDKVVNVYINWQPEMSSSEFSYLRATVKGVQGISLTAYHGSASQVVIPTMIDGLPVLRISSNCFSNNNTLDTVILTKNLKQISNGAFSNCSALRTVYLCDSVESISDDSFDNCNNFSSLRMIAVYPPVYSDHLMGAFVRRVEKLVATSEQEKPRLLFYGGSGMFHAIDGATVDNVLNNEFTVINCGQNANISGILMLDVLRGFVKENDLIFFAPELHERIFSNSLHMASWVALETYYDALRMIDVRNYTNLLTSFGWLQNGEDGYALEGRVNVVANGGGKTYLDYNDSFDEYFTRNYQDVYNGSFSMEQDELPLYEMSQGFEEILRCYRIITGFGTRMYFGSSVIYENGYTNDDSEIDEFLSNLQALLSSGLENPCPFVTNWKDYRYAREYMYDDRWHLTTEGAIINSEKWANAIKAQLEKEATN